MHKPRAEQGYPIGVIRVNVPEAGPDGIWRGGFRQELRGSPVPSSYGSFGLDMTIFRDLSVSALLEYSIGAQLLNQWRARRQVNAFGFRNREAGSLETTYPVYPEIGESLIRNPLTNDAIYPRDPQSVSLLIDGSWIKLRENKPALSCTTLTVQQFVCRGDTFSISQKPNCAAGSPRS